MRRLALMLAAVLLTGCVSAVPTTGPVERVPVSAQPRSVDIAPEPPAPGISPSRLVEGFLQAMADPSGDYSVAREYLSQEARSTWVPTSGTRIYSGGIQAHENGYRVLGTLSGSLDRTGRFTPEAQDFSLDLALVQEEGQWRIATPPEGVLVSNYIFERYYAHTQVYFLAGETVVPEARHVPDSLLTPSRIVEGVLDGPGAGLAPGVSSALPEGVQLAAEGATVDAAGTVHVALTGLGEDMAETQRNRLGAQLLWSLTAIPRVSGLQITNDGTPWPLPQQDGEGILRPADVASRQPLTRLATTDLFAVRDGVAGRLSQGQSFLAMESSGQPVAEVAVSLDATAVAFIDETRTVVLIGPLGGQLSPVMTGMAKLRRAQFVDEQLWVLGADTNGSTRLLRINPSGQFSQVDISEVPGDVVDFAVCPAGLQVALVVREDRQTRLGMMLLNRKEALSTWRPLVLAESGRLVRGVQAVEFSGESELALIAAQDGARSVHRVRVDGSLPQELGPPGGEPVQVAALPELGGGPVVARTEDGQLLLNEGGTRWQTIGRRVDQVTYPG